MARALPSACSIGHAEADHEAVARHVEDGAVVLERDIGQQREELVQQRDDLARVQLFRDRGEAAHVREHDRGAGAYLRLREREVAQLRIGEDLVGELRRDVAAERGADQLALLNLLRQLFGGQLPARGAHAQQRMDSHQELFASDRVRQKVVDARFERRQPLLRRFRDREQRQQHRRGIRLEQAADHGQRLGIVLRIDDEQVRRAPRDARDELLRAPRHRR